MKIIITLCLVLSSSVVACGAADSGKATGDATLPDGRGVTLEPTPTPMPLRATSLYFADASQLPACGQDEEGWLVYVKNPGNFQACEPPNWEVVDVKGDTGMSGAAGKNGKDGQDGAAGQDGAPGKDGASGANGTNGVAGAPGLGDQFTDPDTGVVWYFAAKSATLAQAQATCNGALGFGLPGPGSGGMAFPITAKVLAYYGEFMATLPTGVTYWTSLNSASSGFTNVYNAVVGSLVNPGAIAGATATANHVVLCQKP